jgi:putative phosphoesterase
MRVAILADVHANAQALAPTLAEAAEQGAERLILLGDYVGYHFEASRTLDLLRGWPHDAIRGNHDRALLAMASGAGSDGVPAKYLPSLQAALSELSRDDLRWLRELPETLSLELGGRSIFLCHGSPVEPDAYLYWNSSREKLDAARVDGADAVFMGHTHHPFFRPGTPWLLNPGSVGQARDLGGFASWCLFDAEVGTVSFRRTAYEVEPVLRRLLAGGEAPPLQQEVLSRKNPVLQAALRRAGPP